ncbi:hypothetical protein EP47_04375, partial [Legionella norrlandica]
TDNDLIFRGTIGTKEVEEAMTSDFLGMSSIQRRKAASFNIVDYIRSNNSRFFFSMTPCRDTVKPYATGLPIIPCKGFIWVTNIPMVYTRPQKLLYLNREMFDEYDQRKIKEQDLEAPQRYDLITEMTANNNEITAIVGGTKADNWAFQVSRDVKKIVQVVGPGRILGPFMSSSQPVHVKDWENPEFQKRVWAMEVILCGDDPIDYEKMFKKACEMGLISKDERLLTIEDARAVANSEELEELNKTHKISETHRLEKVPKEIPLGHKEALLEHMISEIKQAPTLEKIDTEKRAELK